MRLISKLGVSSKLGHEGVEKGRSDARSERTEGLEKDQKLFLRGDEVKPLRI